MRQSLLWNFKIQPVINQIVCLLDSLVVKFEDIYNSGCILFVI